MSGRHTWKTLRDPIMSDPDRLVRVEAYQRSMRAVLRLAKLREQRGVTQQSLADALDVSQANISRIEHEDDVYLSTLRSYVEALGGRLNLIAVFPDETIPLGGLADTLSFSSASATELRAGSIGEPVSSQRLSLTEILLDVRRGFD